jgi:hypothetical protein
MDGARRWQPQFRGRERGIEGQHTYCSNFAGMGLPSPIALTPLSSLET